MQKRAVIGLDAVFKSLPESDQEQCLGASDEIIKLVGEKFKENPILACLACASATVFLQQYVETVSVAPSSETLQ